MTGNRAPSAQDPKVGAPEIGTVETDPRLVEYAATHDPQLANELVEEHRGLARHLARRFAHRGQPIEELEQVALIGLLKALDRFDPDRGRFVSFAAPTILGELKRHFRDSGWAVRVPRRLQELHLEIGRATAALSQELGRSPSPDEIARRAQVDEEEVLEAMEAGGLYQLASIDAPLDDVPTAEPADTEAGFANVDQRIEIEALLEILPARDRVIVELRFFGGCTQSEIADRVGLSQMHVSRRLTKSLDVLRNAAGAGARAPGLGGGA